MKPALVPELSVRNWQRSRQFYCDVLGFSVAYERPEEGFSYLKFGTAEMMIDQIGLGRDFDDLAPDTPLGRGVNFQIEVAEIAGLYATVKGVAAEIILPLEDKWYRTSDCEAGNRQFVVADPDGYLLRFFQDLGTRT
ncbi:bleomycin resistance protein [Epibacterium ulvae]|uniref:bleomycin resistance protein n=1 Tax=Epibacterium ulvae TaxID=1156985 RepID=UPI002493B44F|nr:VOC family protein [Epibacterium ulvae]